MEVEQTPYRDETTQVAFEPLDFIVRLVALVPNPRLQRVLWVGNHRSK